MKTRLTLLQNRGMTKYIDSQNVIDDPGAFSPVIILTTSKTLTLIYRFFGLQRRKPKKTEPDNRRRTINWE